MFGRKVIQEEQGYALKTQDNALKLRIDGVDYVGRMDTPEFLGWWKENQAQFKANLDAEAQITLVAGFMVALLGTEQAQKLFNGAPRSLTQFIGLLGYVFDEITKQGYADKLTIPAKYSKAAINR